LLAFASTKAKISSEVKEAVDKNEFFYVLRIPTSHDLPAIGSNGASSVQNKKMD
jgi:hypothetical protein